MLTLLFAAPVAAKDPILNIPLECGPDDGCHISSYMDRDGGHGAADFTCGPLSTDKHNGTDFAVRFGSGPGPAVVAAAPGRVVRTGTEYDNGDGHTDGCGVGVVLDHGGGWQTEYCHLMPGSVAVRKGQRLAMRAVIGAVGPSDHTDILHLHLTVLHDGIPIDPFDPDGIVQCGLMPLRDLWQTPQPYVPGEIATE